MAIYDINTRVTRTVSGGVATDDQAVTGGFVGFPTVAANIIDEATGGLTRLREIGTGTEVVMRIRVTEAFVSAGGGSLNFRIVLGDSLDLVTNLTFLGGIDLPNVAAAGLGAEFYATVSPIALQALAGAAGRRYISAAWIPVIATMDAGRVEIDFGTWKGNHLPLRHPIGYAGP